MAWMKTTIFILNPRLTIPVQLKIKYSDAFSMQIIAPLAKIYKIITAVIELMYL